MFHAPPWLEPRAAYIHIPFCAHHCGYCDFAVATHQDHQINLYLDALDAEFSAIGQPRPLLTRFLGGGTPTYLNCPQLRLLFASLDRWLPLLPGGEFSIEANPDDLTAEKVMTLREGGITRISIGIQSFHSHLLPVLDRRHRAEQIHTAIDTARAQIPQLSLDLIFAIPGQTLADWREDLSTAIALAPDHISTYGLTFEKGTPLWKQRERGQVGAIPEELEREMYECAIEVLEAEGYRHYEISNFARPGKECRHNGIYWANHAYYGFGMGAAGYVDGERYLNTRSLHEYIKRALSGERPAYQSERLDPRERAFETLAIQFRRMEGIDRSTFAEQTGFTVEELVGDEIRQIAQIALIDDDGQRIALSRSGKCVADGIIERLMARA